MKIELTQEEISFILQVLDKTQISGIQNQKFLLGVAEKLSNSLQGAMDQPMSKYKGEGTEEGSKNK